MEGSLFPPSATATAWAEVPTKRRLPLFVPVTAAVPSSLRGRVTGSPGVASCGLRAFPGCGCIQYACFTRRMTSDVSSKVLHHQKKSQKRLLTRRNASASLQSVTKVMTGDKSKSYPMSGEEIRQCFLNFYASRGHKILPSASLVPDDPTVLLTIAGMLQFKPIFLGKAPRQVPRATTAQRCIRTTDVDNVGRTARHHTFFEMLGNFSFGDYFKEEAIHWAWELTTKEYGLPTDRLWVSVYKEDDEAYSIWHDEVGVPRERIKRMGEEDNFWTSGPTGPCGPCSEIYYDFHPERGYSDADLGDDDRFIEFYNLVFMEYNKKDDGSLEPLKEKNIDTGMGLERMAQILQKVKEKCQSCACYAFTFGYLFPHTHSLFCLEVLRCSRMGIRLAILWLMLPIPVTTDDLRKNRGKEKRR